MEGERVASSVVAGGDVPVGLYPDVHESPSDSDDGRAEQRQRLRLAIEAASQLQDETAARRDYSEAGRAQKQKKALEAELALLEVEQGAAVELQARMRRVRDGIEAAQRQVSEAAARREYAAADRAQQERSRLEGELAVLQNQESSLTDPAPPYHAP